MATWPAKTNYATGDVLTAAQMNDIGGELNDLYTDLNHRNPFLNSAFDIWQRGTSISVAASTASQYTTDRWNVLTNANQACTISRQVTGDTTNLPFIQYCARFQRNSGQTGTGVLYFAQSFENSNSTRYVNQTVTLSFYARKGANYSATSDVLKVSLISGTGTDENVLVSWTGAAYPINDQTATLTTTWQRFTFTGTVASTATQLAAWFKYTPTGTAGANDYFEVTGVQLDLGSTATKFQTATGTIQGELAACQRYYYRTSSTNAYGAVSSSGYTTSTTNANILVNLPVPMRVVPTALDFSTLQIGDVTNTYYTVSAMALNVSTTTTIAACDTTSTGMTASRWAYLRANNSTSAYLGFSAEL